MSTNSQKSTEEQEIDMAMVSQKIRGFFQGISDGVFNGIEFLVKYKFTVLALFVIGLGLGFYLDTTYKVYDNKLVVSPNFGSADYLYSKIDLISSKIKEKDTVFLKGIGIEDPEKLQKMHIEPIVDVYEFVNNKDEQNFEMLKLMAENSDIEKIVEGRTTSKNYKYHVIAFRTKDFTSTKKTIEPLLKYLNNSKFYSQIQKESVNNVHIKIKANDLIISQIDGFLNGISNGNPGGKSDKLVYYNENSPLKDVIETKNRLVSEQGNLRIDLIRFDKIVKEITHVLNIENEEGTNGKLKVVLPILFILIFGLMCSLIRFYKTQMLKRNQQ